VNKKFVFPLIIAFYLAPLFMYGQTLKVMSYNIHHGADKNEKDRLNEMGLFIKNSGADLVGLQEVDSVCTRSGRVDQMKKLAELTGMHYAFVRHFAYQGGAYGQGILSKFPLSDIKNNRLSLLKKDTIRESLAMISALVKTGGGRNLIFSSAHYSLDEPTRLVQAKETVSYFEKEQVPVIFTGDLNATPEKEEIRYLDKLFTLTNNNGLLSFPSDSAFKAIDYIYVTSQDLGKVSSISAPKVNYSDHLPVLTSFVLKGRKKK
jgi:endonuclease/exonuclease/phosphatase family metal-dependent hydrolase